MSEAFNTSVVGHNWTIFQEDKLQSKRVLVTRCVSCDILDFSALLVFSSLSLGFTVPFSMDESGPGYMGQC